MLTQQQVIRELRRMLKDKTQKALAEEMGITPVYLSDILSERRDPGRAVLEMLRLEKVTLYKKIA